MYGYIKFYKPEKHYGFIKAIDTPNDIFFHHNDISCDAKLIYQHQLVVFRTEKSDKGQCAKGISIPPGTTYTGRILGANSYSGVIDNTSLHSKGINIEEFPLKILRRFEYSTLGKVTFKKENMLGYRPYLSNEVIFQPRINEGKTFAVDIYELNRQGKPPNIEIDIKLGKEIVQSSINNEIYTIFKTNNTLLINSIQYLNKGHEHDHKIVYLFKGNKLIESPGSIAREAWKIGYSSNSNNRINSLKDKYHTEIEPVHQIYTDNAHAVEQVLHILFKSKCLDELKSWEWFNLNSEDIEWIKSLSFIDTRIMADLWRDAIGITGTEILFRGRAQ